MGLLTKLRTAAMAAGAALAVLSGPAAAGNFTFYGSADRTAPWHGPTCDDAGVTADIRARFARIERGYWGSDLAIVAIHEPRETTFEDWDPTVIARRYCRATAEMSDGSRRGLVYWIRSEQGYAGVGHGVEFCLAGLDRLLAFAPGCRTLTPR